MTSEACKYFCFKKTRGPIISNNKDVDKIELVAFDMDGVLVDDFSSWKTVHDYFNTSNEKSVDEYVKGKIDDFEFIKRDVSLWKEDGRPITINKLSEILSNVRLMIGAKETINFLKNSGIKTAIVSAGIDVLANKVSKELGIDYVFSNGVKYDENGFLTGEGILNVKLMYKDETIKQISKKEGIPLAKIAAVGNSCFDIPMLEISGLGIAFNPADECVSESADIVVEGNDLSKIIPAIEKYL